MPDLQREDEKFLRQAMALANHSLTRAGGGPFGALVVRDGEILGQGFNRVPINLDPTAHAEVEAIRDACKNLGHHQLTGATIYSSSEPCPMCLGAIYWARPARVVFAATHAEAAKAGFDDAFIFADMTKAPEQRAIPSIHLALPGRLDVFAQWAALENRFEY